MHHFLTQRVILGLIEDLIQDLIQWPVSHEANPDPRPWSCRKMRDFRAELQNFKTKCKLTCIRGRLGPLVAGCCITPTRTLAPLTKMNNAYVLFWDLWAVNVRSNLIGSLLTAMWGGANTKQPITDGRNAA